MTRKTDMQPAEFLSRIRKAGWSPTSLSRHLGCHSSMIYHLALGRANSDRLLREIAKVIGVPVEAIRPSTYLGEGPRKPGRPRHSPPI